MSGDTFETSRQLEPYHAIYFQEDFSSGDSKIAFELLSKERPEMRLIVNQKDKLYYNEFMNRVPNDEGSKILELPDLKSGKVIKSISVSKKYGLFTFVNYDRKVAQITFRAQSKKYYF